MITSGGIFKISKKKDNLLTFIVHFLSYILHFWKVLYQDVLV
jgi:hypothetical protein